MTESQAFMEYTAAVRKLSVAKRDKDELAEKSVKAQRQFEECERSVADAHNKLYRVLSGEGN